MSILEGQNPLNQTFFEPNASRAHRLDGRMRERLADSLSYIFETIAHRLSPDEHRIAACLSALRSEPADPMVFGCYFELVLALENREWDDAAQIIETMLAIPKPATGISIQNLPDLAAPEGARYQRLVNTDETIFFSIRPPALDTAEDFRSKIGLGLDLLRRGYPAQAEEIEALLRRITLAVGPSGPDTPVFDGVSSFMLWGGILLNADNDVSTLGMAEVLTHESSHNLLFGLCADGPLLLNDDIDRYVSPLRFDPRPMDGIYHATYVTARIHNTARVLLQSGLLSASEQEEAHRDLKSNASGFADGLAVIKGNATLTPLGRSIMDSAEAYMDSFASAD